MASSKEVWFSPRGEYLQRAVYFNGALTRRAKHRHNDIIETSLVHPRGAHPLRVFSSRFSRSDGGGALRPCTRHTWSADRRAVVRTIAGRARANVPARGARPIARAAAVSGRHGDRVRARNDRASPGAICRAFSFLWRDDDCLSDIARAYEPDKLMGYCVAFYFAKLLVWDKVLGFGSTDALAGFAAITDVTFSD
ncbi:hypothetical protein [Bradyrhizobium shewense]|nr:hypothetical protein [Bradyrhizobium shewense]